MVEWVGLRSRPRDPAHPTPTSVGRVTSHSIIDKIPVTETKRLVCFNLVSVREILLKVFCRNSVLNAGRLYLELAGCSTAELFPP